MTSASKFLILIVSFVFSLSAFSYSANFTVLSGKYDPHCPNWNLERFSEIEDYITVGVFGAESYGYDIAIPISRTGVDVIWCAVQPHRGQENKACENALLFFDARPFRQYAGKPVVGNSLVKFKDLEDQYDHYFAYVEKVMSEDKVKRPNVGAILEFISRYFLQEMTGLYPLSRYTITGGVSYNYAGQTTKGELDIIVYDKESCKVEVIGEAKASSPNYQRNSLRKALSQLSRFEDFLASF